MRRIALLLIMCLVLSVGCSSPAVIDIPIPTEPETVIPTEEPAVVEPVGDEPVVVEGPTRAELIAERTANFMPDFPWDEIGWTVSRRTAAEEGEIVYLGDWHPHPSVVGLPEEVPGRGWPTDPLQETYLSGPHIDCRDSDEGLYLVGFTGEISPELLWRALEGEKPDFETWTVQKGREEAPKAQFLFENDRGLEGLGNPTYNELLSFLAEDKTNEQPREVRYWVWSVENPGEKVYISEAEVEALKAKGDGNYYSEPVFVCTEFATMLRENANNAGWRSAYVALGWLFHAVNAFETTDRGLVLVAPEFDTLLEPVITRYDPYPVPFGGEAVQRNTPQGGVIIYLW